MTPVIQAALEEKLSIALFWGIAVILLGQWGIMTFMWPRTHPQWAVWAKTTAFLSVVIARLILFYSGNPRFPFPIGAVLNLAALLLILYFGYVYLWQTWIRGKYRCEGGKRDQERCDCGCADGRYRRGYGPYDRADHRDNPDRDPNAWARDRH